LTSKQDSSTSLFELYKIYRDSKTRKILRRSLILECITIVISAFVL